MTEYIDYNTLSKIFYDKFKATPDEIRFWIKRIVSGNYRFWGGLINIRSTDIETLSHTINDNYFYPECFFYHKVEANEFIPPPASRFVYVNQLVTLRNWIETKDMSRYDILRRGAEKGILRFYDDKEDKFTFYYKVDLGGSSSVKKWHLTDFCQQYIENSKSFFLIEDILKLERHFLKKPLEYCLADLGIKPTDEAKTA